MVITDGAYYCILPALKMLEKKRMSTLLLPPILATKKVAEVARQSHSVGHFNPCYARPLAATLEMKVKGNKLYFMTEPSSFIIYLRVFRGSGATYGRPKGYLAHVASTRRRRKDEGLAGNVSVH